jgi:hypothetical protein
MKLEDLLHIDPSEWPEDAREIILAAIDDVSRSEDDRANALIAAGEIVVIDDVIARRLIRAIKEPVMTPRLRGVAAIALGPILEVTDADGFEDEDIYAAVISKKTFASIRETLQAVFEDSDEPKFVRRKALEASVRAPEKWHTSAIRKAYASDDVEWKTTSVFCMGHVRGFEADILAAFDDTAPQVRFEAVRAAGNASVKRAWRRIVELLEAPNTDRDLLLAAIESAASVDPAEAQIVLRRFCGSDDEEIAAVAEAAIEEASIYDMAPDVDD